MLYLFLTTCPEPFCFTIQNWVNSSSCFSAQTNTLSLKYFFSKILGAVSWNCFKWLCWMKCLSAPSFDLFRYSLYLFLSEEWRKSKEKSGVSDDLWTLIFFGFVTSGLGSSCAVQCVAVFPIILLWNDKVWLRLHSKEVCLSLPSFLVYCNSDFVDINLKGWLFLSWKICQFSTEKLNSVGKTSLFFRPCCSLMWNNPSAMEKGCTAVLCTHFSKFKIGRRLQGCLLPS